MGDIYETMERIGAGRVVLVGDPPSGLRAIIALDDLTLGPAMGGIRTQPYGSVAAAMADAHRLASAMSLKCAIAGLPAGGGKTVVMDHPGLDRPAAFAALGRTIEGLGGRYRAAGDLGTTAADLACASTTTRYVNTSGAVLGATTATTVLNCMRAGARHRGHDGLAGLRVAVQGCGLIGRGVAEGLASEGATVLVADHDSNRARVLAGDIGAQVVAPDMVLGAPVDVISPCATGGIISSETVADLQAWMICGGANNQLNDPGVADLLVERQVLFIPDFLASSGAVISGACLSLLDGADPAAFFIGVEQTTAAILARAEAEKRSPVAIAETIARERIMAARADRGTA